MRLRIFDRLRSLLSQGTARLRGWAAGQRPAAAQPVPVGGRHRRAGQSGPATPVPTETIAAQPPVTGPDDDPEFINSLEWLIRGGDPDEEP